MIRQLGDSIVRLARHALLVAACCALVLGCQETSESPEPAALREPDLDLEQTAERVLAEIQAQEGAQDATCWTTVRQMESFYVKKTIDELGTLTKIESVKNLIFRVWLRASNLGQHTTLTADDIDDAAPSSLLYSFGDFREQAMVEDYQGITESYRIILSILYESIAGQGIMRGETFFLSPLSEEAIRRLGNVATNMTVQLLASASRHSDAAMHNELSAEDMKAAYQESAATWNLDDAAMKREIPQPQTARRYGESRSEAILRKLSRIYVLDKVKSLKKWNAAIWKQGNETFAMRGDLHVIPKATVAAFSGLFSQMVSFEVTDQFTNKILNRMISFANPVLSGYQAFESPVGMFHAEHSIALEKKLRTQQDLKPEDYLDLPWVREFLDITFPRQTLVNGDIRLSIMDLEASESIEQVDLLAPRCDAMRDTTVAWYIFARAQLPRQAASVDPFAAEYIAERLSEYAAYLLKESERVYQARGEQAALSFAHTRVPPRFNFIGIPVERSVWNEIQVQAKADLVSRYSAPLFERIGKTSGISSADCLDAVREHRDEKHRWPGIQRNMGSGIAVGDIDGDGLSDLFTGGAGCNRMWRNRGEYAFDDVSEELGIIDEDYDVRQSLLADVDNDGKLDLLVLHSFTPSRLFMQQPDGRFLDETEARGLNISLRAHTAFFFDYDNDGLLDLYVGSYGGKTRQKFEPTIEGRNGVANQLFHNEGGKFSDVTTEAGVGSTAWTLASGAIDHDGDGYMDFYLANDFGRDQFFHNRKDGTFEEISKAIGTDDRGAGMSVSLADVNYDGQWDIYVSMIDMFSKKVRNVFPQPDTVLKLDERIISSSFYISGNKLFVREGEGFAPKEMAYFEPGDRGWSWSANFFDYDNDGDEDMYLSNGWTYDGFGWHSYNQFFLRDHDTFYQYPYIEPKEGPGGSPESFYGSSRSAVSVDLNNSGRMDLIVGEYDGSPRVLRNLQPGQNHWIKVRLRGDQNNHFGIGSTVRVFRREGPPLMRMVSAGSNYLSQEDSTLTFGLGQADEVERIEIAWPGGRRQQLSGPLEVNRLYTIDELP